MSEHSQRHSSKGSPPQPISHNTAAVPWVSTLALLVTIPAFYLEMVAPATWPLAAVLYFAAAAVIAGLQWPVRRMHFKRHALQLVLAAGLLASAALPSSSASTAALAVRLAVAMATLVQLTWTLRPWVTQGSLAYLLGLAVLVLGLCGLGFWWLEPKALTLADGLWLAFTTAATVGFGDIVPTTPASKIFSVFVVLLGYGVLSLVTAAIAAQWVETEERRIEREILRDLNGQLRSIRSELTALRTAVESRTMEPGTQAPHAAIGQSIHDS